MITIGDFARLSRVSVRMLRHYDALGLLRPEHVDPRSGYRFYTPSPLHRLNRIVALKDLGLRLDQVHTVVDGQVSADDLRAMLRLRQAELEDEIRRGDQRLARVQARLRLIDAEDGMTLSDVHVKDLPATTLAGLGTVVPSATQEDIGPVMPGLFGEVIGRLSAAGLTPVGPGVAWYTPAPEHGDDALRAHAAFPVPAPALDTPPDGLERLELPAGTVASVIHRGAMDTVDATYQLLSAWAREQGRDVTGAAREVYLEVPDDPAEWVTEVQLDLR